MAKVELQRWVYVLILLAAGASLHAQESPAQTRAAFLKLLDRPKVALDPEELPKPTLAPIPGIAWRALQIASERKADGSVERVPILLALPEGKQGALPAVIVLHGTGGSKEAMAPLLRLVAERGMIGVAIDARYHGARAKGKSGSAAYVDAITRAWRTSPGEPMEHPFYYDTVWDLWRLVDYLQTRGDVDARKIGMLGISMGGIQTWLAAAGDERIRVIVPAIAVQSFRFSLDHDQWQGRANTIRKAHEQAAADLGEPAVNRKVCEALWTKLLPGILDQFDCPAMLALCAERPLLILSGTKDANCPVGGAKLAIAAAQKAYRHHPERLRVILEDVGHTVTPAQRQAAIEWFERWLLDRRPSGETP